MFKKLAILARNASHGRPAGRPVFKNYDRWLKPVDRLVDRPKPRVWVRQSVDRSINHHGVQSTARSTGKRTYMHTPMGQNYGRPF